MSYTLFYCSPNPDIKLYVYKLLTEVHACTLYLVYLLLLGHCLSHISLSLSLSLYSPSLVLHLDTDGLELGLLLLLLLLDGL